MDSVLPALWCTAARCSLPSQHNTIFVSIGTFRKFLYNRTVVFFFKGHVTDCRSAAARPVSVRPQRTAAADSSPNRSGSARMVRADVKAQIDGRRAATGGKPIGALIEARCESFDHLRAAGAYFNLSGAYHVLARRWRIMHGTITKRQTKSGSPPVRTALPSVEAQRSGRISKTELRRAVKAFRELLRNPDGSVLTQVQFAPVLGVALSTLQRYEQVAPPRAPILARLVDLAEAEGAHAFVDVFSRALRQELNISPYRPLPNPKWVFEVDDPEQYDFMRIAQRLAADPQYEHLREPFRRLTSDIRAQLESEDESN